MASSVVTDVGEKALGLLALAYTDVSLNGIQPVSGGISELGLL